MLKPHVDQGSGPAYAAATCAALFAAVSLYWAVGGTAGLGTVGGYAEEMAHSGTTSATVAIWSTVALKTGGAVLALSLVRPWGAAFPRRLRAGLAVAGTVVITLYGAVFEGVQALVVLRVIRPSEPVNWTTMAWHLALWDAWFLAWGLLLGWAAWRFIQQGDDVSRSTSLMVTGGVEAMT